MLLHGFMSESVFAVLNVYGIAIVTGQVAEVMSCQDQTVNFHC